MQSTAGLSVGQIGAVTNCLNSAIFEVTGFTATTISHALGSGAAMSNSSSTFRTSYVPGAQFIPLQQTAYFVAQGQGTQSTLMSATMNTITGGWTIQPLVPGVDSMQVLYGVGSSGSNIEYVAASSVTDWSVVSSIQLGFLLQGQLGSGATSTATGNSYSVLGTTITVPSDGRLRHVFQMTIDIRNAT